MTYHRYLLVDIGCIECGSASNIVGLFPTETEAETARRTCAENLDWHDGRQHIFEVFDLEKPQDTLYTRVLTGEKEK